MNSFYFRPGKHNFNKFQIFFNSGNPDPKLFPEVLLTRGQLEVNWQLNNISQAKTNDKGRK